MFSKKSESKHPEIESVLEYYFEGYLKAESEMLLKGFHKGARLFSSDQGKLNVTQMDEWVKNLNERKAKGDIRKAKAETIGIDITEDAAIAKVRLVFPKFNFVDYLSLLKVEGKWTVVNKIYTVIETPTV